MRELREADRLIAESILLAEVIRHLEISHQMYQRWRSQYGARRREGYQVNRKPKIAQVPVVVRGRYLNHV